MHEVSLAGGVLASVEAAAERERFVGVKVLRLEVGRLAGVEVEALRFALEAIAPGTCLAGARVVIEEPTGSAWCMNCSATVPLAARGDPCARCGGYWLQPNGGTELRIVDLIVDDAWQTSD
ncbi:hydrogenase maturation nickel metallochaperone HypA [Paraburkholderia silvatlantica]|uniref:Hydrogenase maturation factor HypA n=1 Tax=Paraburkholderia silvatlantica TaxID=321895 RepID=A0A2V4T7R3_9BURK|nr:hydrogenase maturation nickel metallochaperone HypA [Paraburkholderia silvatlantica]PYE21599.1 hydrogenase nickel incorporation protein HypA/HybF [Paraburkholderia silvatlantica]TDQ86722.1 hydrogenase nickel incorporation protein HypA/HybF [Paraburkholderia silvatlantica]